METLIRCRSSEDRRCRSAHFRSSFGVCDGLPDDLKLDQQFLDHSYNCSVIKYITPIAVLGVGGSGILRLISTRTEDGAVSFDGVLPLLLSSVLSGVTCVLFWKGGLREWTKRNYNVICACQLLQLYVMTLWSDTEIELAAGKEGTCAHGDVNKLLRGSEFGKYVSILSTPAVWGMDGLATYCMCICACAAFAVANLVLDAPLVTVGISMLFQMGVGLSAAYFSGRRKAGERDKFAGLHLCLAVCSHASTSKHAFAGFFFCSLCILRHAPVGSFWWWWGEYCNREICLWCMCVGSDTGGEQRASQHV
jgi:hypothetical protein